MTTVLDIPELVFKYAQQWNLLDLCALLKTNKTVSAMMNDNKLAKIIIENQMLEPFPKKPNELILRFLSYKSMMAAKQNDAETMEFVLKRCNYCTGLDSSLNFVESHALQKIFQHDADLVLACVWNHCISTMSEYEIIEGLLPLLAEYTIQPCYMLGSSITFKNISKTFDFVLKKLNYHLDTVISLVCISNTHRHYPRKVDYTNLFRAIIHCKNTFPEYFEDNVHVDLGIPSLSNLTPLEYAAREHNRELFDLFLECGATIDNETSNYCYNAYLNTDGQSSSFIRFMIERGISTRSTMNRVFYIITLVPEDRIRLSKPMREIDFCDPIRSNIYNSIIEDLLYNGAKLKEEEASKFMTCPIDSDEHWLWQQCCTDQDPYTWKSRIVADSSYGYELVNKASRYKNLPFKLLNSDECIYLHSDQTAGYYANPERDGTWAFEDNVLNIHFPQKELSDYTMYNMSSSYDNYSHHSYEPVLDMQFKIVKLYNDRIALLPIDQYQPYSQFDVYWLYMLDLAQLENRIDN